MKTGSFRQKFKVVTVLAITFVIANPAYALKRISNTVSRVNGELVVKLKDAAPGQLIQARILSALQSKLGDGSIVDVNRFKTDSNLYTLRLASDSDVSRALNLLKSEPSVAIAEPNYRYYALDDGAPNDPEFGKLWGLNNTGQTDAAGQVGTPGSDIHVMPLWQKGFTGSRNVLVAVVDTGLDWNHPDLKDNLYTNPGEIAGNGLDDDHNGFIDDIHGWNFADKNANSIDNNEHGSHCAGTIGGTGNNGVGVAGVNWQVSLLPVKFLKADGSGSLADAVEAINYARIMKANVISNSWGGGDYSEIMRNAIIATRDAGALFVAAAGNDGSDNDSWASYPASYDVENIVSVAATDNKDQLASFSNFGKTRVHVAAPGVKIFSTIKDGGYEYLSGTSMATPHVSGIAALVLSGNPQLTYADLKERLIRTSDPVAGLKRKVAARGRVNAYSAFYNIVVPNDQPVESDWKKTVNRVIQSAHPYGKNANKTFEIKYPGAKFIRVFFEKVDTEMHYDKVTIENPAGEVEDEISGLHENYTSDYVEGDKLVVRFTSDDYNEAWGFKITKFQVVLK